MRETDEKATRMLAEARGEARGKIETEDRAILNALKKGKLSPEEIADMLEVSLERFLKIKS